MMNWSDVLVDVIIVARGRGKLHILDAEIHRCQTELAAIQAQRDDTAKTVKQSIWQIKELSEGEYATLSVHLGSSIMSTILDD